MFPKPLPLRAGRNLPDDGLYYDCEARATTNSWEFQKEKSRKQIGNFSEASRVGYIQYSVLLKSDILSTQKYG